MAIIQERSIFGRSVSSKELKPGEKSRMRFVTGLTLYPLGSETVYVESPRAIKIVVGSGPMQKGFSSVIGGESINATVIESSGTLHHFGIRKKIVFQEDK